MPAHCFFPGVRPIGVCEVMRRIVGKAAFYVIRDDIQTNCSRTMHINSVPAVQIARTEAAVHVLRSVFNHSDAI